MKRRALATLLAVSFATSPAYAQRARPPAPTTAPKPAGPKPLAETLTGVAKEAYDSARLLYGAGDFAGASLKYKVAYDASHEPRLLWNIAAAEKSLHHYARALPLVRQYLVEGGALLGPEDKAEAKELLDVMEPLTAKLTVTASEPGAEVLIDDEPKGPTPLRGVLVDIGTHKVRVRKADFEESAKDVVVSGGGADEITVDVKLVKTLREGRLIVKASPDATIALDDTVVGTGTFSGPVASGAHRLRVAAPKMVPQTSELLIQNDQVREVSVTLEREPGQGIPAWALIGGGVVIAAALGLGAYFIAKGGSGDNGSGAYNGPSGTIGTVQASHPFRIGF